jgi:hypothetical protein
MTSRVHITLSLTAKQAEFLGLVAVGAIMASEKSPLERASWKLIHEAIRRGEEEARAKDEAMAARTYPCRHCGRKVVHSARGNRLPPTHDCPHGKDCSTAFGVNWNGCGKCRKEYECQDCHQSTAGSTIHECPAKVAAHPYRDKP